MDRLQDQTIRQQCLSTHGSFIVQAPAGSGKTALLTQRFLSLLAKVQQPESIVAMTFTRKAAKEMRDRILDALRLSEPPEQDFEKTTWRLAQAVLQQNERQQWDLLDNPNRLQIQTIDSFCAHLINYNPLSAGTGAKLQVADNAEHAYQQTVTEAFAQIDNDSALSSGLSMLYRHLDNRQMTAQNMLINMLAHRGAWLPVIGAQQADHSLREQLENNLANMLIHELQQLEDLFPASLLTDLSEILHYRAEQLDDETLIHWQFGFTLHDLTSWQQIAELLLTQDGQWRKTVTAKQGFPAPSQSKDPQLRETRQLAKQHCLDFLAALQEYDKLRHQLKLIKQLPDPHYPEQQWQLLEQLLTVLPELTAQLMVNFQTTNTVDHTEISLRALRALGDEHDPSDLAYLLDYQIQHLLIDEFQDTSHLQFLLIEKLIRGWTPDDGRSLFLVGDPMQSIYRFRQAEVNLFLRAQTYGLGELKLTPLTLSSNFRSQENLITWHNHCFKHIFPNQNNFAHGAVAYSPSHAARAPTTGQVYYYNKLAEPEQEAQQIIAIIQQTPADQSIAILVRARHHLHAILPALKQADVSYQATALEPLIDKFYIQDLLSLTEALCHLGNRLAWLSLLRTPFVGLNLQDLHTIAYQQPSASIWSRLQHYQQLPLTQDGKLRCQRIVPCLQKSLEQRARLPLIQWIENTWLASGGADCLPHEHAISDIEHFFELLEQHNTGGTLIHWDRLHQDLGEQTTDFSSSYNPRVEIMTIHKAKGLEFDVVILPHLHKRKHALDKPLLRWSEVTHQQQHDLLLAPIQNSLDKHDPIYNYLHHLEQQKDDLEQARLLYVATTRAKESLHLLAIETETSSTFSQLLKPFGQHMQQIDCEQTTKTIDEQAHLQRLSNRWQLPESWQQTDFTLQANNPAQTYDMHPHEQMATVVGTITHQWLQRFADQGLEQWSSKQLGDYQAIIQTQCRALGLIETKQASEQIIQALQNCLEDTRGRWILSPHQEARSEYKLTSNLSGEIKHVIIDRTFIDEAGNRWIIDYKTTHLYTEQTISQHLDDFLPQLQHYAAILAKREQRPCFLGLYFPLIPFWHSVAT